jgi:predicted nucleotidyltransferase
MVFTEQQRGLLKRDLVECLRQEKEIVRIIIFGSFLRSPNPNDVDVAVFQDSSENYLGLAMKYRRKTRPVSRKIPLDIIPLKAGVKGGSLMAQIADGEVIYER